MLCFLVVSYCSTELTQHAITDKQRSQWTQFIVWTLYGAEQVKIRENLMCSFSEGTVSV